MTVSQWDWSSKLPSDMVREFHAVYGLPITTTPGLPSVQERALRENLLSEEYWEYVAAEDKNDLVAVADALADMIYIIHGTALSYGIPIDEIFNEVHRSNMSKLDENGKPLYRDDGKVLKGPNYEPPQIGAIIDEQIGKSNHEAVKETGTA